MSYTSRNAHRPFVSMKAHIRLNSKYIYNPLKDLRHGWKDWLEPGEEVKCCHTLDDEPMYCVVENLKGERFGKVHVATLRLAGDFSRK